MSSGTRMRDSTRRSQRRWSGYVGAAERRRGQKAERDVAGFLRVNGWPAITTRAASGFQKGDDIATDAPISIEVKDHVRLDLAGWVRQARENSKGLPAVVWHKRRGVADPGQWYVTMTGHDLIRLLGERDATCAVGQAHRPSRTER